MAPGAVPMPAACFVCQERGGIWMKHTGTKCLETARLLLRPFRAQDGKSCLRCWAADPDLYRYISQEPMSPQDVADSEIARLCGPQTYYWAIVEQASGDVIGEIFVDDFSGRNGWCELDWKVGKAFQGKGYATEAARAVLRYLFGRSASTGFRPSAVWKTRPRSASCSASAWCGKVSCEIFFSAGITAGTTWCCTPRFPQP